CPTRHRRTAAPSEGARRSGPPSLQWRPRRTRRLPAKADTVSVYAATAQTNPNPLPIPLCGALTSSPAQPEPRHWCRAVLGTGHCTPAHSVLAPYNVLLICAILGGLT